MSTGRGESLAQRVANTLARQANTETDDRPVPPIKHCWYDGPHGRQAALLLEWRTVSAGHDGRIAVTVPEGEGWALVEMWVEAAMLTPA